jgi:hypothetical protein
VTSRLRHRLVRYAASGVVGTTLLAGTSGAVPAPSPLSPRSDVVSSAHPTTTAPSVRKETARTAWVGGAATRVNSVATTSATCDGCQGGAVSVQVVEVAWGWQVQADNVATAWAQCPGCGAGAVSVQVVLLRHPADLTANNRSLAVTGACSGCTARAAAYQVVVHATGEPVDPDRLREELAAWASQELDGPDRTPRARARTTSPPGPPPQRRLAGLERRVADLVDGAVLRSRAAVRTS